MAQTTEWPMQKFYFRVEIDGLPELGFQAVEGFESEVTVMEYRAGNSENWYKTKRPGQTTYANITMKKGQFEKDDNLMLAWKMFSTQEKQHKQRKNIIVSLMNEAAEVVMQWQIFNAFIVKFTPTSLDAEADSEVAVEEIEWAIEEWQLTY
jgi:phage tail-like protein